MDALQEIQKALIANIASDPNNIKRFFKTSPGSYAEMDEFLGITVPALRKIAKTHIDVTLDILQKLLLSKFNEERLLALLILIERYNKGSDVDRESIYGFYLANLEYVNNWNLVDASAHLILGRHLHNKDHFILTQLAKSDNLWRRRIAIVTTLYFIKKQFLDTTFCIAELLLHDTHDLIHKATGWMLREAGKQNKAMLLTFLQKHSAKMPRTMLRYAIEKLPAEERKNIMQRG